MNATAATAGIPLGSVKRLQTGTGFRMLDGVTVLDLTTSIAGPYATMLLSDFGADIIKIEKPGGDDARHWGPPFLEGEGLWFLSVNRNKKSVVLDLTDQEGRDALFELAASADVVVTNQPPSVQTKLGLTADAFRTIRPDIIFTAITGFGLSGERRDLTCYDLIAEGHSGVMDLTGAQESPPQKVGAPAADMLAGQDAAMATMAALIDRQRTGQGHVIDVALAESMTRFLTCRISSYLGSGETPRRSGGTDSVIAIYQAFETSDHPITLGLGSDGIWRRFWQAVGQPDYAARPEFASNAERRERRAAIVADIQEILTGKDRDTWLTLFAEARVPAGPINRIDEMAADPAFQDRGLIAALDDGERLTPHIGLGIHIDGQAAAPRAAAPRLGAHTHDVLNTNSEPTD